MSASRLLLVMTRLRRHQALLRQRSQAYSIEAILMSRLARTVVPRRTNGSGGTDPGAMPQFCRTRYDPPLPGEAATHVT